jgi:dipeptidyl aminopeptidase/acylaminoacyl peptidase
MLIEQSEARGLGHIYAPSGEGRHPALLLLHGSEGAAGWLGHRDAAILAAHGYLALPLAYAVGGNPWIGGDIWNAPLDLTEQAMAALRAHPRCNGRLGVYGWSRGAEHALLATGLMAQAGSPHQPDAVAAHAPPDRVFSAWRNLFYRRRETGDSIAPPPTWGFMEAHVVAGLPAWTWRGAPVPESAVIPIEAYAGPVFLSVGEADELWPADMAPRLAERLRAAGRDVTFVSYPGQRHMPNPATWNLHLENLLNFFGRALRV